MEPKIAQDLPKDLIPYDEIKFCGNELRNVKHLIEYKGYFPVLIGKGDYPLIWIYNRMKIDDEYLNQIAVEKSVAHHPDVKVDHNIESKKIQVTADVKGEKVTIISIDYSQKMLIIDSFNIKNLGMGVYGNSQELWVGDTRITNNVTSDAENFISIID